MLWTAAYASNVYIDGTKVDFTEETGYSFAQNGRTYVPLRITMESFGADVEWEQSTNTAIVRKDGVTVRCVLWESAIYRNNVKIPNDAAAVAVNGRIYLPIRAVLEAFGATVEWDGNVKVTSPGDAGFIDIVEKTPSVTTNYWPVWSRGINLKNSGDHNGAINTILSVSSLFLQKNDAASCAMLYKHLGDCYSALGNYERAEICYTREAFYWEKAPGMEQCVIDAARRAKLIGVTSRIYVKTSNEDMDAKNYFGEMHEPKNAVYLGAYAEGDKNIYNPYDPERFYMDTYPELVGKDVKGYILYVPYGQYVCDVYASHVAKAIENDKILQIALEPHAGLWQVNDTDGYLINLAKQMENSGCRFLLRFACEMNDVTSEWYTSYAADYIEKFRIVANVFHTYAPSVPLVWSPNFYPEETISDYYPGDEYVDYVGISSYMCRQTVTDPLGQGVDRARWSSQLDTLYSLYGHKKPIIISEGASSYTDPETGADTTDYAKKQIEDFYTYLPIKYPNVKMAFYFNSDDNIRRFMLSANSICLNAYKNAVSQKCYSTDDEKHYGSYYELGNNVPVEAGPTELCAHITTPANDVSCVVYYINGVEIGTGYGIPFRINADFSSYKGQPAEIRIKAYNSSFVPVAEYTVNIQVQ